MELADPVRGRAASSTLLAPNSPAQNANTIGDVFVRLCVCVCLCICVCLCLRACGGEQKGV